MKALTLVFLLSLGGCATIQNHPYATSVAVAIVAGSIAASVHHDNRETGGPVGTSKIGTPICTGGACQ